VIKPIISVGFNKSGEADFEVNSTVYGLAPNQLNELAAMCFAAFHAAYSMRNCQNGALVGMPGNDDEKAKAQTFGAGFAGRPRKAPP
jgi:hypothetical protein